MFKVIGHNLFLCVHVTQALFTPNTMRPIVTGMTTFAHALLSGLHLTRLIKFL